MMLMALHITYPTSVFQYVRAIDVVVILLPTITVGLLTYITALLLIDREFRALTSLAIKELLKPLETDIDKLMAS